MPRVLVKHVNPVNEASLNAAKSDWENGLFKSVRAAARAYDVSQMQFYHQIWMLMFSRSLTQH
jgi:hypothetical protein